MRLRNRGELLNEKEIAEIIAYLYFTEHGLLRINQRGRNPEEVKAEIEHCKYAYFNTDYSINIVLNEKQCYVINKDLKGYALITYKEDTHCPMSKKRQLAMRGIDR